MARNRAARRRGHKVTGAAPKSWLSIVTGPRTRRGRRARVVERQTREFEGLVVEIPCGFKMRFYPPPSGFGASHKLLLASGTGGHLVPGAPFESTTARFWVYRPPHCLKKNGTAAATHWFLILAAHCGCIGRACGPLSPPTMTQWIPRSDKFGIGPSSGSIDRNLTVAGTARRFSILSKYSASSIETPCHTLRGHSRSGANSARREARLVSILEYVPVSPRHRREYPAYKILRYRFVKQIAHAVDENAPRLFPLKRQIELIRM